MYRSYLANTMSTQAYRGISFCWNMFTHVYTTHSCGIAVHSHPGSLIEPKFEDGQRSD